ncbi:MAG: site-specific integrase [Dehalococcoidia bacterium]
MPIRKYRTSTGATRYQADVAHTRRGLPRVKRSFPTRKEAEEWLDAVRKQSHAQFIGARRRYTFGEALIRYLAEESPRKRSGQDDHSNALALRYPFQDGAAWRLLEHTPLEDMVPALNAWTADQRQILRRSYVHGRYYVQRPGPDGAPTWYYQPHPTESDVPQRRDIVRDAGLLTTLADTRGRGPVKPDTLRIRQVLAGRILRLAWKRWQWIEHNLAGQIELESPGRGRDLYLTEDELTALIDAAAQATLPGGAPDPVGPHFADAIAGAALIGWRRTNGLRLEWPRVVFPVFETRGGERRQVQGGMIWVEGDDTKNTEPLAHPIDDALLALLERRWTLRLPVDEKDTDGRVVAHHHLVFHDGTGHPFGDFRKRFLRAKQRAGIDPAFRWHDLRHTWASHLAQRGVSDRVLQELGGWKDQTMVRRYSKLRVHHLLEPLQRARGSSDAQ